MGKYNVKKKIAAFSFIAAIVGGLGYSAHANHGLCVSSKQLMSNEVEALSRDENIKPKCYTWAHLDCGSWVYYAGQLNFIKDDKHKGYCWENSSASRGYHEHECSSCNDNG